jgi:pyruvate,water dikinase
MLVDHLYWLDQIQPSQRKQVGDKALSLGLLMQRGYPAVPGFVISASLFQEFLEQINWVDPVFTDLPNSTLHIDVNNPRQLQAVAQQIQQAIHATPLSDDWLTQLEEITQVWQTPALMLRPSFSLQAGLDPTVSHRTTGLLEAHTCWTETSAIAHALKQVWAELFRARSLLYWQRLGVPIQTLNLAVLVQPLWPAIASGDVAVYESHLELRAIWGLGNALTRGEVMPDCYDFSLEGVLQTQQPGSKLYRYRLIDKPDSTASAALPPIDNCVELCSTESDQQQQYVLNDDQVQQLIQLVLQAKTDLGSTPGLEWIICQPTDQDQPKPYLTQVIPQLAFSSWRSGTRQRRTHQPESRSPQRSPDRQAQALDLRVAQASRLTGVGAAPGKVTAPAWVVNQTTHPWDVPSGVILVAPTITPDQLIGLKQVAGVITEQGGMTSHGAILARELGIPAVVGVSSVTHQIQTGDRLIMDGDRGEVHAVPDGNGSSNLKTTATEMDLSPIAPASPSASSSVPYPVTDSSASAMGHADLPPPTALLQGYPNATNLFVTLSQPDSILQAVSLPVDGVGLLRSELMLLAALEQQHPRVWLEQGRQAELIDRMTNQIQQFTQAFAPRPVFYRSLDLRSHEFPTLADPSHGPEPNPILGQRGTFSYQMNPALFEMELAALRQVQQRCSNLRLILPFVRTVEEFSFCQQMVEQAGLTQNPHFQLWIMAEVPSVLLLLPDYIKAGVQGIAIGSNDLTQLLLGADRDQPQMADLFNPAHPAVMRAIQQLIQTARQAGIPCSLCGELPRSHADMIDALVRWGITAISVNPGEVESVYRAIARSERQILLDAARQTFLNQT